MTRLEPRCRSHSAPVPDTDAGSDDDDDTDVHVAPAPDPAPSREREPAPSASARTGTHWKAIRLLRRAGVGRARPGRRRSARGLRILHQARWGQRRRGLQVRITTRATPDQLWSGVQPAAQCTQHVRRPRALGGVTGGGGNGTRWGTNPGRIPAAFERRERLLRSATWSLPVRSRWCNR